MTLQGERWLRLAERYTGIEAWGQAAMHWSLVAVAIGETVILLTLSLHHY